MKRTFNILGLLLLLFAPVLLQASPNPRHISFNFYGDTIQFDLDSSCVLPVDRPITQQALESFYESLSAASFQSIVSVLITYKTVHKPDDWFFYQLIRRTAQQISPKEANYERYTAYKWFLLRQCGYDALLTFASDKLLFYVQSDDKIYNIPTRISLNKQYICLNYHDYGLIDFNLYSFKEITLPTLAGFSSFSYKITRLPEFAASDYREKEIHFQFYNTNYQFKIKLNTQIQQLFANYPVLDYSFYFDIPLSTGTYSSLIPQLKKNLASMRTKDGVDYLMRFTRYAFLYQKDEDGFGKEKRMSAEETLLYDKSDCEDRVALFFYLVKEIYDLPMIVLTNDEHVTLAVQLQRPIGQTILYNGQKYSICEPTPQGEDIRMGQLSPAAAKQP
ncbi:MAG: hypothetical protein H7Y31_16755, partial [Chitinophagaceae bacterium]|nr:hypothetical protein [Chitinophagaceae bacterium]